MLKRIYLAEGIVQGNLRSHAILARAFIVLGAVLILAASARPAAAAPFAYVANSDSNTVSVIDTATNKVVGRRSRWGLGLAPWRSPSPRTGRTPMWRMVAPALSR